MIKDPLQIVLVLLTVEMFILFISTHPRFKKYFQFLPALFWIYFTPMLLSTWGVIDPKSDIYGVITKNFLPASLFLLLVSVDVKAIMRLGKPALIMFFVGGLGVVLGAPIVFAIFHNIIGDEFWSGFGALAGSWTGGSANMIAVKEALGTPDEVFLPMVVIDTIIPYFWMGILITFASFQKKYDHWNHSERKILDDLSKHIPHVEHHKIKLTVVSTFGLAILAAAMSMFSQDMAKFFPVIKDVVSPYTWTIIIASLIGLLLSFTPARKFESKGSTRIGYFFLYFVLTSIGAKANLNDINVTFALFAAGVLLMLIHALFLFVASRIIKAPMFLMAVASQANVGGVASAPIVAEVYQGGLASVGLLMAITGNIFGTYLGIIAGQLCRLFIAH